MTDEVPTIDLGLGCGKGVSRRGLRADWSSSASLPSFPQDGSQRPSVPPKLTPGHPKLVTWAFFPMIFFFFCKTEGWASSTLNIPYNSITIIS